MASRSVELLGGATELKPVRRILAVDRFIPHMRNRTCYFPQEWDGQCWRNMIDDRKGCHTMKDAEGVAGQRVPADKREILPVFNLKLELTPKNYDRCLIIGNGESGKEFMGNSAEWFKERYDAVFVLNEGWKFYEYAAKATGIFYWVCLEVENYSLDYSKQVPPCFKRVVNKFKIQPCLEIWYPQTEMQWVERAHNDPFIAHEYGLGLQHSPETHGTVVLHTMHLCSVWNCHNLDLIGVELSFGDRLHYWLGSEPTDGERVTQTALFTKAAEYIRSVLPAFQHDGVKVNILCKSLITQK